MILRLQATRTNSYKLVSMQQIEFRTRVHIADVPVGLVQKCFRCSEVLINGENCASSDGHGMSFWAVGSFLGVVERADGRKTNPIMSMSMDHDATEADEVSCA